MSKALIIYGYYDERDHFGTMLDTTKRGLEKSGITDYEVINTFEFTRKHLANNPVDLAASTAEWFRGHRTPENEELIKQQQEKILSSTHLIFIYPIWWESLPHYMVSWLSEVFRSVSFRINDAGQPIGQWGENRQALIMTTAGFSEAVRIENFKKATPSNAFTAYNKIKRQMELCQTYSLTTALQYAGIKKTQELHISEVKQVDDNIAKQVEKAVKNFICPKHIVTSDYRLRSRAIKPALLFSKQHQHTKNKNGSGVAHDDNPKPKTKIKIK